MADCLYISCLARCIPDYLFLFYQFLFKTLAHLKNSERCFLHLKLHLQFNHSDESKETRQYNTNKYDSHKASSYSYQLLLQRLLLQVQVLPLLPHITRSDGYGCYQSNQFEEYVQQFPSALYLGKWKLKMNSNSILIIFSFLPKDPT